jgi:two-component system response regulator
MKQQRLDPVVMVDDDEDDLYIAKQCYEMAGLDNPLLTFNNGEAFLAYLDKVELNEASLPVYALIDINMPRMNGFAVVRKIREREQFRKIPLIMMFSNSSDEGDKKKAKELGADEYLVKPHTVNGYLDIFRNLSEHSRVSVS